MDPDGPKTYGSYGSGTLLLTHLKETDRKMFIFIITYNQLGFQDYSLFRRILGKNAKYKEMTLNE
jgi:hypothetical protein